MVGLPCAGKTTAAKEIETRENALRLTPDEWQIRLFGQDAAEPEHDCRHDEIEAIMWTVAERALLLDTSVILDFGFWAKEEREDFRARAKKLGADFKIHYCEAEPEELIRRLRARNEIAHESGTVFHIAEKSMVEWISWFQPPDSEELER